MTKRFYRSYDRIFIGQGEDLAERYVGFWFEIKYLKHKDASMQRFDSSFLYTRPNDFFDGDRILASVTSRLLETETEESVPYIAVRVEPQTVNKDSLDPIYKILEKYGLEELEDTFPDEESLVDWLKEKRALD